MSYKLHQLIKSLTKYEYSLRGDILTNISIHIDKLNRDNILCHASRNKLINKLATTIITLNSNYNDSIINNKENPEQLNNDYESLISRNCDEFNTILNYGDNIFRKNIIKCFDDTDKLIYELFNETGSEYISDLLKLKIGSNYRDVMGIDQDLKFIEQYTKNRVNTLEQFQFQLHNCSALLDILIKYFVPIEMYLCNKHFDNEKTTILVNKYKYDKVVNSEESSKFKFEIMMNNCYKITIKCAVTHNTFIVYGYFNYDVMNTIIATSQISCNFIYHKKKLLSEHIRNNLHINKDFCDAYLNNLSIGEIISNKGSTLKEKIIEDYDIYKKSCNVKFKVIVNDFLKSDLTKKFNILRCLLLGSKNSVKYAAMLFGMTKDQNAENNNRSCIADILFRNLNHHQQMKLRKSGQYIKQELDRIRQMTIDDMDLKQQCIMNNNMSDYIKKCAMNKIEEMKLNNNEYYKNLIYVKSLLDYPWISEDYSDIFSDIGSDINKCREKLDLIKEEFEKRVFGQTEFKTVICDIIGKWFTNPKGIGKSIGLCGPPGCGKTLIASGLGKVLGMPYQEIHLGGLEDGSVLNGHSFTYSGAQPGLIITKMINAGVPRCILFFDELDKTCERHGINEIFNVLIHVTDSNTNSNFCDKYFQDVTFPLNKCIFVFSFNDVDKIDPILKDRMEIINVTPYTLSDKIQIAKKYLMSELLEGIGIENGSITMANSTIEYVISKYTHEAGVRKLKNCMEKIFLKVNIDRIYKRGSFKNKENFSFNNPIKILKNDVVKYLGKPLIEVEKIHNIDQIGVVNGLYATTNGTGGIVPILCYPLKNGNKEFTLEITGKQGKVMKESVNFAWTIAKNCIKTNIVNNFYRNNHGGIHVHTPEGAVSKDGPSAGAAFATAFISRITGFPIKRDIAMTGEISIGGYITAIGGLEYKLNGAKIAGVKLVFVCEQNFDDLVKILETNKNLFNIINPYKNKKAKLFLNKNGANKKNKDVEFKVMIINSIYDIIPYVLIDPEYVKREYPKGSYKCSDKTCDWSTFMTKNDNGFENNNKIDTIFCNEKSNTKYSENNSSTDTQDND
jgi:endopeptidase La